MKYLFSAILMFIPFIHFGQINLLNSSKLERQVHWDVAYDKIGDGIFEIIATATINDGFHIWDLDAGGDGSLINTSIEVKDAAKFEMVQPFKSMSEPTILDLDFIEGAVRWHDNKVIFKAVYKVPKGSNIHVVITYQACNHEMCFPPEDLDFNLRF